MKKLIILISVIIIFFVFFLYMYFLPRNYEKEYELKEVKITEIYNKEKEFYYFNFNYQGKDFEYLVKTSYTTKRNLISDIKIVEEDEMLCLVPQSEYIDTYPLCFNSSEEYISYNLIDFDFSDYQKEYELTKSNFKDININYLNEKTFLIWDYKGFIFINKGQKKEINILKKDCYNLDLVAQINNYILVPDYDSNYTFDKIYVIDLKNGSVREWELETEIYFDSYIVGTNKKSVYLFDYKNEVEYELRPDKLKMRKVKFKAIINDKWQNISLGDFNKKTVFSEKKAYNFELVNNKLYLRYLEGNTKILLSQQEVKEIVYIQNDTVYYLVGDKLYMYNNYYGEVMLIEYFEWNFNYNNMIYIY